jgi:hypothetical protein
MSEGRFSKKIPGLPIEFPKKTTCRWKNGNISSSKKMKRKMRRHQCVPYASDTTGPPCKCYRNKCWSLLQGGELHILITSGIYWDLNIQNAYLFPCIKATRLIRVYTKKISKYEAQNLLGCTDVFLIECRRTFQRCVLPP